MAGSGRVPSWRKGFAGKAPAGAGASWMAAKAGVPVGPSIAAMDTLALLDDLPATGEAFRSGRLSLA
jgi:hypothetical protein